MPHKKTKSTSTKKDPGRYSPSGKLLCKAITTRGTPCKNPVLPGLTVCASHGGGTRASLRKSKRAKARAKASLWGIAPEGGSLSIEEELTKLAHNKLTDITALRIELSKDPENTFGLLVDSEERSNTASEMSFSETSREIRRNTVHPLLAELHKAETELLSILRLLQEVTGGAEEVDTKRLKVQTAREVARLMRAYPGISVDAVAKEVVKNG